MSVAMCRACLSDSVLTQRIRNTQLQEVYEKLSNTKLIVEDGRPETVCHTCCLHLQRCYDFSIMSQKADHMLTQLYRDDIKISSAEVAALHRTLDSLGSINPAPPDDRSEYKDATSPPLMEYPLQVEVTVKEEPDSMVEENYSYISDDINIEDTYNNGNDDTKLYMPCAVKAPPTNHEAPVKEEKYTCEHSKKTFSFKKNLAAHIKLHIGERLLEPKGEHLCTECNASFALLTELRQHMRCHSGENTFICKICKITVPNADLLKIHMKIHTSEKPYRCEECGKSLSDKQNFVRHMRLHSGEKPYACNLCDYRSSYSDCLKSHIASHTGEALYHCIECNVSFTRPFNLQRHNMRSHTGEFACELCSKKFSDSGKLKNHNIMVHPLNKSFNCTECNASFTRQHNLRRHMRSHSEEKPYVCDKCDYKSAHPHRLKLHLGRKHK